MSHFAHGRRYAGVEDAEAERDRVIERVRVERARLEREREQALARIKEECETRSSRSARVPRTRRA